MGSQFFFIVSDVCFAMLTPYGGGRHVIFINNPYMLQVVSRSSLRLLAPFTKVLESKLPLALSVQHPERGNIRSLYGFPEVQHPQPLWNHLPVEDIPLLFVGCRHIHRRMGHNLRPRCYSPMCSYRKGVRQVPQRLLHPLRRAITSRWHL